jgi:hypothetical protein
MHDPAMLRFLSAVQKHCETATTLMRASGLHPLALQKALAAAEGAGLVEATGAIHPALRLTAAGHAAASATPIRGAA